MYCWNWNIHRIHWDYETSLQTFSTQTTCTQSICRVASHKWSTATSATASVAPSSSPASCRILTARCAPPSEVVACVRRSSTNIIGSRWSVPDWSREMWRAILCWSRSARVRMSSCEREVYHTLSAFLDISQLLCKDDEARTEYLWRFEFSTTFLRWLHQSTTKRVYLVKVMVSAWRAWRWLHGVMRTCEITNKFVLFHPYSLHLLRLLHYFSIPTRYTVFLYSTAYITATHWVTAIPPLTHKSQHMIDSPRFPDMLLASTAFPDYCLPVDFSVQFHALVLPVRNLWNFEFAKLSFDKTQLQ